MQEKFIVKGFIFTWTFYEVPSVRWALTSGSIWRCGKRTVISSIHTLSQASSRTIITPATPR